MTEPQPGWYPSPDGTPRQTWWDGGKWTEHTAPAPTWHEQQMLAATQQSAKNGRAMRGMAAGVIFGIALILIGLHLSGRF